MYKTNLSNELRRLWMQHVFWTRSFIISTAENLGDLNAVTQRLLRNPKDFAAIFEQFYGMQIAEQFENLFTQHLRIGADLVNAAKAGNTTAADEARKKWYANADALAAFFAQINPYWSQSQWKELLYQHLKMTEEEAILRLNRHYEQDVAIFDTIETDALKMAEEMVWGLSRQFGIR